MEEPYYRKWEGREGILNKRWAGHFLWAEPLEEGKGWEGEIWVHWVVQSYLAESENREEWASQWGKQGGQ